MTGDALLVYLHRMVRRPRRCLRMRSLPKQEPWLLTQLPLTMLSPHRQRCRPAHRQPQPKHAPAAAPAVRLQPHVQAWSRRARRQPSPSLSLLQRRTRSRHRSTATSQQPRAHSPRKQARRPAQQRRLFQRSRCMERPRCGRATTTLPSPSPTLTSPTTMLHTLQPSCRRPGLPPGLPCLLQCLPAMQWVKSLPVL